MSDNPQFWIDVVRTQAHVTDCREKTQALTNAADAFKRIIETMFAERERAADCIGTLIDDKYALKADLSSSRAECELLRDVLRKTKTCNLNTEVRELVNSVLRPAIDQSRQTLEAK